MEQIEYDRRERAEKFVIPPTQEDSSSKQPTAPMPSTSNSNRNEFTRIQFKRPDGASDVHTFNSTDTYLEVRNYVHNNLLLGTGIRDFVLITTFPRKEFGPANHNETLLDLGLVPSAVLLIIATSKAFDASNTVSTASRGFIGFIYALIHNLMIPINTVFNYVSNYFTSRNNAASGAQKRSNEDKSDDHDE